MYMASLPETQYCLVLRLVHGAAVDAEAGVLGHHDLELRADLADH